MRRYDDSRDATPHETNALVLGEADGCFGEPFPALFDAVRQRLTCDKLRLEEYYHDLSDLDDRALLIQHGIWLVHYDCLQGDAYPVLHHYLETESYPDGTVVVVCIDDETVENPSKTAWAVRRRYDGSVAVVADRDHLVGYLTGVCNVINPCSPAGLEFILDWNNDVCDDLEIV